MTGATLLPLRSPPAGPWLTVARVGWVALALPALILFFAGLAPRYAQLAAPPAPVLSDLDRLGLSPQGYAITILMVEIVVVGAFAATAAVLFWYRSDEPMVVLVALMLVTFGTMNGAFVRAPWALAARYPALDLACRALAWTGHLLLVLFFLLFPNGRFVPAWSRWLAPVLAVALAAWIFSPRTDFLAGDWGPALFHPMTIPLLGCLAALQIYRYLRVSDEAQRQQTHWVVFGVAGSALGFLEAIFVGYGFTPEIRPAVNATAVQLVGTLFASLALLATPVSFGVAVTRHHLFSIDIILNRALVYGGLTVAVVSLYVLIVGYFGALFHTNGNLVISLVATGVVAVLFQPLRDRLQRVVNRLLYGERDEPYAVISRLGQRLEGTLTPDAILPAVVETVAGALKLPYVAIVLGQGVDRPIVAATGTPAPESLRLPLTYQGEMVGELLLAPRAPGEDFSPADRRLLADLARQAGVAARAVRLSDETRALTADLQASRERLVLAREEERRRLRRDLHDGLGPRLASLTLRIDTAHERLAHDPLAGELLSDLAARMEEAVVDIRRVVYALRPPALDDLGLLGALRAAADSYGPQGLRIAVEEPATLPVFPAAVEVAAYRIAHEALTNVVRHAAAQRCTIRIELDLVTQALLVEVDDDGCGVADLQAGVPRQAGLGLISMRERAAELGGVCTIEPRPGGGTRVRAVLPCRPLAAGR